MPSFDRKDLLLLLALIVTGAIVHGVALSNPFYFDDLFVIRENAWLHGVEPPAAWFGTYWFDSHKLFAGFRPLLMLSFYVNALFFGTSPASFRVVNIALHISNSIWVALLFRLLMPRATRTWLCWVVGFLFLLHPIQTLGVNFIWKRSELLGTAIILIQMIAHVHGRQQKTYGLPLVIFQLVGLAVALLIKESALLIPAYILLVDLLFFSKEDWWRSRSTGFLYLGSLLMTLGYYLFRYRYVEQQVALQRFTLPNWHSWDAWSYFKVSLGVIPKYIGLWVFPAPRLIDDPAPPTDFPWGDAIATALLLLASILTSIRFWSTRWVAFAFGLFWITILPSTSFRPLFFPMDQIRLYLPLAGLCGVAVLAVSWASDRVPRILQIHWVIGALLLVYGSHSFIQNRTYAVPAKIWQDVVTEYEHSDLAWASLGQELAASKLYPSAAIAFLMASRCESRNAGYQVLAYHNMMQVGVPPDLVKKWLASTLMQNLALPDTVNLAVLLRELDEKEAARLILLDLLNRFPDYAPAHLQLAAIFELQGNKEKALHHYRLVLQLMPEDREARLGLKRLSATMDSIKL